MYANLALPRVDAQDLHFFEDFHLKLPFEDESGPVGTNQVYLFLSNRVTRELVNI